MSDLQVMFCFQWVLLSVGHLTMSAFRHNLSSCVTVLPSFLTAPHQYFCSFLNGSHYDVSLTLYSMLFCQYVTVLPTFSMVLHQYFCSFLNGSHYDVSLTLYSMLFCQYVTVLPTFSMVSRQYFCLFSVAHITMSPSHRTVTQPATVRQTCSCQCAIKTRRCIFHRVMLGACLVHRMVW